MTYSTSDWTAWLAALIEGEGSVLIGRAANQKTYRRGLCYVPIVQISNTDVRVLDRAADITAALIGNRPRRYPVKRSSAEHKLGWAFQIRASWRVVALVPLLMPYLVGKRDQADIVLSFAKRHVGRAGGWRTDAVLDLDELDYARCRILNRRGNHGGPDIDEMERMVANASAREIEQP